ncbi:unnamed protein product [Amoebophrya sp. A120]|nr:unnamed protein product [Amoebophrya sp. A120]|eukprot:GSA120T00012459001.1
MSLDSFMGTSTSAANAGHQNSANSLIGDHSQESIFPAAPQITKDGTTNTLQNYDDDWARVSAAVGFFNNSAKEKRPLSPFMESVVQMLEEANSHVVNLAAARKAQAGQNVGEASKSSTGGSSRRQLLSGAAAGAATDDDLQANNNASGGKNTPSGGTNVTNPSTADKPMSEQDKQNAMSLNFAGKDLLTFLREQSELRTPGSNKAPSYRNSRQNSRHSTTSLLQSDPILRMGSAQGYRPSTTPTPFNVSDLLDDNDFKTTKNLREQEVLKSIEEHQSEMANLDIDLRNSIEKTLEELENEKAKMPDNLQPDDAKRSDAGSIARAIVDGVEKAVADTIEGNHGEGVDNASTGRGQLSEGAGTAALSPRCQTSPTKTGDLLATTKLNNPTGKYHTPFGVVSDWLPMLLQGLDNASSPTLDGSSAGQGSCLNKLPDENDNLPPEMLAAAKAAEEQISKMSNLRSQTAPHKNSYSLSDLQMSRSLLKNMRMKNNTGADAMMNNTTSASSNTLLKSGLELNQNRPSVINTPLRENQQLIEEEYTHNSEQFVQSGNFLLANEEEERLLHKKKLLQQELQNDDMTSENCYTTPPMSGVHGLFANSSFYDNFVAGGVMHAGGYNHPHSANNSVMNNTGSSFWSQDGSSFYGGGAESGFTTSMNDFYNSKTGGTSIGKMKDDKHKGNNGKSGSTTTGSTTTGSLIRGAPKQARNAHSVPTSRATTNSGAFTSSTSSSSNLLRNMSTTSVSAAVQKRQLAAEQQAIIAAQNLNNYQQVVPRTPSQWTQKEKREYLIERQKQPLSDAQVYSPPKVGNGATTSNSGQNSLKSGSASKKLRDLVLFDQRDCRKSKYDGKRVLTNSKGGKRRSSSLILQPTTNKNSMNMNNATTGSSLMFNKTDLLPLTFPTISEQENEGSFEDAGASSLFLDHPGLQEPSLDDTTLFDSRSQTSLELDSGSASGSSLELMGNVGGQESSVTLPHLVAPGSGVDVSSASTTFDQINLHGIGNKTGESCDEVYKPSFGAFSQILQDEDQRAFFREPAAAPSSTEFFSAGAAEGGAAAPGAGSTFGQQASLYGSSVDNFASQANPMMHTSAAKMFSVEKKRTTRSTSTSPMKSQSPSKNKNKEQELQNSSNAQISNKWSEDVQHRRELIKKLKYSNAPITDHKEHQLLQLELEQKYGSVVQNGQHQNSLTLMPLPTIGQTGKGAGGGVFNNGGGRTLNAAAGSASTATTSAGAQSSHPRRASTCVGWFAEPKSAMKTASDLKKNELLGVVHDKVGDIVFHNNIREPMSPHSMRTIKPKRGQATQGIMTVSDRKAAALSPKKGFLVTVGNSILTSSSGNANGAQTPVMDYHGSRNNSRAATPSGFMRRVQEEEKSQGIMDRNTAVEAVAFGTAGGISGEHDNGGASGVLKKVTVVGGEQNSSAPSKQSLSSPIKDNFKLELQRKAGGDATAAPPRKERENVKAISSSVLQAQTELEKAANSDVL